MKNGIGFWIATLGLVTVLCITYSNHFHNSFQFDDSHTLVDNQYVKDIRNVPLLFTDPTTRSTNPMNRAYRPLLTATFAFDFWMADGKVDPFWFHVQSFSWFILLLVLLYLFFIKIFTLHHDHRWNKWLALFCVAWFGLNAAHTETINYISARSDSLSTFFVVLALVIYQYSAVARRFFLYLIPVFIGMFVKPTVAMFAPILVAYIWLIEEQCSIREVFKRQHSSRLKKLVLISIPVFIVSFATFYFTIWMTPKTWVPGGNSPVWYALSQPYVILHYFQVFFLPMDLSPDADWKQIQSLLSMKFILGTGFLLVVAFGIWKGSQQKRLRPISFGLLFFLFALVPSSSVIPLAEIMNYHRVFFPNVGLVLVAAWVIYLFILKYEKRFATNSSWKMTLAVCLVLLLGGNAFASYQKNKIWKTPYDLWEYVVTISPHNGRAWMNYGLAQMRKGENKEALASYEVAAELWPVYGYIYVNRAICKAALGYPDSEVEADFRLGKQLRPNEPSMGFYYARWLYGKDRKKEALRQMNAILKQQPGYYFAITLKLLILSDLQRWDELERFASSVLKMFPDSKEARQYLKIAKSKPKTKGEMLTLKEPQSHDEWIEQSLDLFYEGEYEAMVNACKKALEFNPNSHLAYNNMCSAYLELEKWDKAVESCEKAVTLKPDFVNAVNNLELARQKRGLN